MGAKLPKIPIFQFFSIFGAACLGMQGNGTDSIQFYGIIRDISRRHTSKIDLIFILWSFMRRQIYIRFFSLFRKVYLVTLGNWTDFIWFSGKIRDIYSVHISEIGLISISGSFSGEKMPKIPNFSISQKFVEIGLVWKLLKMDEFPIYVSIGMNFPESTDGWISSATLSNWRSVKSFEEAR